MFPSSGIEPTLNMDVHVRIEAHIDNVYCWCSVFVNVLGFVRFELERRSDGV
jgi:hypothetical protein